MEIEIVYNTRKPNDGKSQKVTDYISVGNNMNETQQFFWLVVRFFFSAFKQQNIIRNYRDRRSTPKPFITWNRNDGYCVNGRH